MWASVPAVSPTGLVTLKKTFNSFVNGEVLSYQGRCKNQRKCSEKNKMLYQSIKQASHPQGFTCNAQIIGRPTTWYNYIDHHCCWLSQELLLGRVATFLHRVDWKGWNSVPSWIFLQPRLGSQETQGCSKCLQGTRQGNPGLEDRGRQKVDASFNCNAEGTRMREPELLLRGY